MVASTAASESSADLVFRLYRLMARTRAFEARSMQLRADGEVLGNTFPSLGQEALCAVGLALAPQDVVFPSYRSRPLFFGKGISVEQHFRELAGSASSGAAGHEVFHHASWPAAGMMPSSSMIGGWVPMAAGHALAQKLDGEDAITVCAIGDGALGAGDLHEALNFIGLWRLPVLMICENNEYQVSARWDTMRHARRLGAYAAPHGFETLEADGNDAVALHDLVRELRPRVAAGTPVFVDCMTYRMGGYSSHIGEPRQGAEAEREREGWRARDPLRVAAERIAALTGETANAALAAIEREEEEAVAAAWARVAAEPARVPAPAREAADADL
jgi:TPP-dependent pyruvate/acetoin dehydrogenase alpha subunit